MRFAALGVVLALTACAAPSPPPDLTAELTSPTDITLTWPAVGQDTAATVVEFATAPAGPYTILEFLPPDRTTFHHRDLIPETTFYYRRRPITGPTTEPIGVDLTTQGPPRMGSEHRVEPGSVRWRVRGGDGVISGSPPPPPQPPPLSPPPPPPPLSLSPPPPPQPPPLSPPPPPPPLSLSPPPPPPPLSQPPPLSPPPPPQPPLPPPLPPPPLSLSLSPPLSPPPLPLPLPLPPLPPLSPPLSPLSPSSPPPLSSPSAPPPQLSQPQPQPQPPWSWDVGGVVSGVASLCGGGGVISGVVSSWLRVGVGQASRWMWGGDGVVSGSVSSGVRGSVGLGSSPASSRGLVGVGPGSVPAGARGGEGAPTELTATVVAPDEVRFEWTDNSVGEEGFLVESRPAGEREFRVVAMVDPDVTSHGLVLLPGERVAEFRVRSYRFGPASTVVRRTTGIS